MELLQITKGKIYVEIDGKVYVRPLKNIIDIKGLKIDTRDFQEEQKLEREVRAKRIFKSSSWVSLR